MSLIWTICGAGRGVGKTTVALKLCELLPESIYVKHGHGILKSGKSENFFNNLKELQSFIESSERTCKHIIVESNVFAKLCRSDIIIYLDGIVGKTHFRNDAGKLMAIADINIDMDSDTVSWKKALASIINSEITSNAICDLLLSQKQYLFSDKKSKA